MPLSRPLQVLGGLAAVTTSLAGLTMGPALKDLIDRKQTSIGDVRSLRDALRRCRATGLQGWQLVSFAQHLVYDKFAIYSCRNLWDTPGGAFRYGMGYCSQYNLALAQLLTKLGFQVEPVFALKIQSFENPDWNMGHTWLRVTYEGETREMCAGSANNEPGAVLFRPISPVHKGRPAVLLLNHLGLIFYASVLEWRALLTRQPLPSWMFQPRQ